MTTVADQLERLRTTQDSAERNALALDLSDSGNPDVMPVLLELIQRPELVNHRGTLVYCLEPFDCRNEVELLVDLLVHGNFEVAAHAAIILDELQPLNEQTTQCLLTALRQVRITKEAWRDEKVADLIKTHTS